MAAERSFLFLQGPQSAFFRSLGLELLRRQHKVNKINFCGGDVVHWPRPFARWYQGPRTGWSRWIARLMEEEQVTDLLLFGDWRPLHHEAILLARMMGIRIFVFEEGYLRPDYITMEQGGVNGSSKLPKTPEEVKAVAAKLDKPDPPRHDDNPLSKRVFDAVWQHVGNTLLFPLFPYYRTHRPYAITRELVGWIPRYLSREQRKIISLKKLGVFYKTNADYFLFPLQLDADAQVRRYSPFSGMMEAIMHILASFAQNAPKDKHIILKNHPLDNGLVNYQSYVKDFSEACGIESRVHFVEGGDAEKMMEKSSGVVLLNSTIGLTALTLGTSVYCIGKSIYSMPGLASALPYQTLDSFWTSPIEPDHRLLQEFIKVLRWRALVNGNFYSPGGIARAIENCMVRLGVADE